MKKYYKVASLALAGVLAASSVVPISALADEEVPGVEEASDTEEEAVEEAPVEEEAFEETTTEVTLVFSGDTVAGEEVEPEEVEEEKDLEDGLLEETEEPALEPAEEVEAVPAEENLTEEIPASEEPAEEKPIEEIPEEEFLTEEELLSDEELELLEADEKRYDAIILARGGGSFEDLFCFNDEQLVKTIYSMKTFLVSGVGHEQDFTLTDFVADLRAATPTAAVELITPDIEDVRKQVDLYVKQLYSKVNEKLDRKQMNFDFYSQKLFHYIDSLSSIKDRIDAQINTIRNSLLHHCDMNSTLIDHYNLQIASEMNLKLNNAKLQYKRLNTLLEAYSAQNVLERGYSIIMQNGKVVKRKSDIQHETFDIRFFDGILTATEKE